MKVKQRPPNTKPKPPRADQSCNLCAVDFIHSLEVIRNADGLAVHLDCMGRERILKLKAQIKARENELDALDSSGNATPYPTPASSSPSQLISTSASPLSRQWAGYAVKEHKDSLQQTPTERTTFDKSQEMGNILESTTDIHQSMGTTKQPNLKWEARMPKRKWEEYIGKENRDPMSQLVTKPRLPDSREGAGIVKRSPGHAEVQIIDICNSDEELAPRAMPATPKFEKLNNKPRTSPMNYSNASFQAPPSLDQVASALLGPETPSAMTQQPIKEPPLCAEQKRLVSTIMSGRNVFYTGSAGCGKSTVLKNFVKRLKAQKVWKGGEHKEPKQVDIIAPTGRAALDINGSTSWTYAGWNPESMKKPLEKLKEAAEHGKWIRKRLRATDVLVIDEVSMMENHHLERLNEIMQSARGNIRAFGGVQLVVTGDFCQLPPVKPFVYCYKCGKYLTKSNADTIFTCPNGHGSWQDSEKWAFCSSAWSAADFIHVNLTTIHRQNDRVFIDILQKCRLGVPFTPQEEDLLLTHDSQTGNAVKIFSTRQEVGAVNREAFNRLRSPQKTYNCYDDFRCYNKNLESKGRRNVEDGTLDALRDHRFDPRINLKQGMVVVLLVNLDQEAGLVNGSQGVVMGFEKAEDDKMPEAIKKDEKDFLRLGAGPVLTGEHAEIRAANIRSFMDNTTEKSWPIVLFQNRITRTIFADCRVTELGDESPYSLISRTQIPLVAGWAMTVHKSQGMTLNRVVVDLRRSFEEGQMYVALSRARGLEGLRVEGLGRQMGCNERVREFLRERLGVKMP